MRDVPWVEELALHRFIVELERGVWIAGWSGDPGRTLVRASAQIFGTSHGASTALGIARRYRPFKGAKIEPVTI